MAKVAYMFYVHIAVKRSIEVDAADVDSLTFVDWCEYNAVEQKFNC